MAKRAPKLPILARNRSQRGAEPKSRQVKGGTAGGKGHRNIASGRPGMYGEMSNKGRR